MKTPFSHFDKSLCFEDGQVRIREESFASNALESRREAGALVDRGRMVCRKQHEQVTVNLP